MADCRRTGRSSVCAQTGRTQIEAAAAAGTEEDMPMRRYVSSIPELLWSGECCQLRELNQILDYQNKILVEILAALERLRGDAG